VAAQVPIDRSHPIDNQSKTKFPFQVTFYFIGFQEVFKVIYIGAEIDWRLSFNANAGKHSGVISTGLESDLDGALENF
jgi:hypothetical protein